jgi:Na+/proline symporter
VWFKSGFHDLYEMLPGFFGGLLITVVVSLFTRPPSGAEDEMRRVREEVAANKEVQCHF